MNETIDNNGLPEEDPEGLVPLEIVEKIEDTSGYANLETLDEIGRFGGKVIKLDNRLTLQCEKCKDYTRVENKEYEWFDKITCEHCGRMGPYNHFLVMY